MWARKAWTRRTGTVSLATCLMFHSELVERLEVETRRSLALSFCHLGVYEQSASLAFISLETTSTVMRGKLHLPVFQHYLYQNAMEPLLESSSLQIGPSSSETVAQDYELIAISGNCERRMLQRIWWPCVLCKKALMLIEVWILHETIWPDWLKSWRAQIQEVSQAELKKGPFVIVIRHKESQQETILFFICNSIEKCVICD